MAKADKKILIILNRYFDEKNALEKLVRQININGYEIILKFSDFGMSDTYESKSDFDVFKKNVENHKKRYKNFLTIVLPSPNFGFYLGEELLDYIKNNKDVIFMSRVGEYRPIFDRLVSQKRYINNLTLFEYPDFVCNVFKILKPKRVHVIIDWSNPKAYLRNFKNNEIKIHQLTDSWENSNKKEIDKILNQVGAEDLVALNIGRLSLRYFLCEANLKKFKAIVLTDYNNLHNNKTYFFGEESKFNSLTERLGDIKLISKDNFYTLRNFAMSNIMNSKEFSREEAQLAGEDLVIIVTTLNKLYDQNKNFTIDNFLEQIRQFNGNDDFIINLQYEYAYDKNCINFIKSRDLYITNIKNTRTNDVILLDKQLIPKVNNDGLFYQESYVNQIRIDFERVNFVDISQGIWSCRFRLDIFSKFDNPLDFIKIANISKINYLFDVNLMNREKHKDYFFHSYFLDLNLDFDEKQSLYPFDRQFLRIEFFIKNEKRNGILSQINIDKQLKQNLHIDGWTIERVFSGLTRKKEIGNDREKTNLSLSKSMCLGLEVERESPINFLKMIIPLTFLILINFFGIIYPFESDDTAITITTTAFLAGIALYFSSEKPKSDCLSILDLAFLYFYIINGFSVILIFIDLSFNINLFYIKFVNFLFLIIGGLHIYRNLKKFKFEIYDSLKF